MAGKISKLSKIEFEKVIKNDLHQPRRTTMGEVLKEINAQSRGEAAIVSDVGQHQTIDAGMQNLAPQRNITSGGLGTMGFALPAFGAKMATPEREVVAVVEMGASNDY